MVIDCNEVFIERPSNLTARAQTSSNQKLNNTAKYLIGSTSSVAVKFYLQIGVVEFQTNKLVLIHTSLIRFQWVIVFWQTEVLPSKKTLRLLVLY